MPKIGWPALLGLGALFLIVSALVGGEGNQGVLGQMASHSAGQDSEASENAATRDTPINLAEMPDEVAPEAEDDEFGKPVVDEIFSDDFADLSDMSSTGASPRDFQSEICRSTRFRSKLSSSIEISLHALFSAPS